MGSLLYMSPEQFNDSKNADHLSDIIITICPIARACSSEQSINLGSAVWHRGENIERGAFEHISLAGKKSLIKTFRSFIKYEIKDGTALDNISKEYDKVCELRHGIVHSNSRLAGKNALKLGIDPIGNPLKIEITYSELQECASICTTMVTTFNSEIFIELARRWETEWREVITIDKSNEHAYFKEIWNLHYSKIDEVNQLIPNQISMMKCKNLIKRYYEL